MSNEQELRDLAQAYVDKRLHTNDWKEDQPAPVICQICNHTVMGHQFKKDHLRNCIASNLKIEIGTD